MAADPQRLIDVQKQIIELQTKIAKQGSDQTGSKDEAELKKLKAEERRLQNEDVETVPMSSGDLRGPLGPTRPVGDAPSPAPVAPPPKVELHHPLPPPAQQPVVDQPSSTSEDSPKGFLDTMGRMFKSMGQAIDQGTQQGKTTDQQMNMALNKGMQTLFGGEQKVPEAVAQKFAGQDVSHVLSESDVMSPEALSSFKGGGVNGPMLGIEAAKIKLEHMAMALSIAGEGVREAAFADKPSEVLRGGGDVLYGASMFNHGPDQAAPLTAVGMTIGAFARTVANASDRLTEWSDRLHDASMKFAEFSPSMASVEANSRVRDIVLSQQRGERRAEAADKLAQARDERRRQEASLEDLLFNFINAPFETKAEELKAAAIKKFREVMGLGDEPLELGTSFEDWANEITDARFVQEYGRPPMFNRPRP